MPSSADYLTTKIEVVGIYSVEARPSAWCGVCTAEGSFSSNQPQQLKLHLWSQGCVIISMIGSFPAWAIQFRFWHGVGAYSSPTRVVVSSPAISAAPLATPLVQHIAAKDVPGHACECGHVDAKSWSIP